MLDHINQTAATGRYPVDKNALRAYLRHQSHRRLEQLSRTHRSRVSVTPDSLLVRPMQGQAEKRMEHAFSNYLRHQPISVVKRELRGESLNEKEHRESAMRGELNHHAMPPHHQSPSEIEKVAMRCGSASLSLCHCLCLCLCVCVVCVFVWTLAQGVGARRILRGNIDWRQKQDQVKQDHVKHAKVTHHKAESKQGKLRSEGGSE